MSETVSAPAGDTSSQAANADFGDMVKELGIEDLAPEADETADKDEVRDEADDGHHPEGIPPRDVLKVNGKEIEQSYAEIKAAAQKYHATEVKLEQAKKQLDEAKQSQQQVAHQQQVIRNLLGVLQRGDFDTIADFATEHLNAGETFNKGVIAYALKLYEMSKMSPEQREAIENKKMLMRMRQEAEQRQKQDQERAFEYRVNQWSEHISTEIPKAIQEVGLVDSPFVREHIVSTWRNAIEAGKNPTAKAVAAFVKKRLDEAKVNYGKADTIQQAPQRPRATRESVTRSSSTPRAQPQGQGYSSWDDWKANRGR